MTLPRGILTVESAVLRLHSKPVIYCERLADGLWTVSDGRARAMFAEGRSGVIVFDTLSTPGAALAFREVINNTLPGKQITTIVYTHDHLDAAGWAAVLSPSAEIMAHEACAEIVKLRAADGQSLITRSVQGEGADINLDGLAISLRYPGPTHGTGNLAISFPEHRLLYMSGTALPNARYGFFPDYHIGSYARCMRRLLALEFDRFVPGRYDVCDRAAFVTAIAYFEAMDEACQQAYLDHNVFVWVMDMVGVFVADRLRPAFGHLDGFEANVRFSAFRISHHYLMGGWGLEDTRDEGWALFEGARHCTGTQSS